MGQEIGNEAFSEKDFKLFNQKLHEQIKTLSKLLQDPDFGVGEQTLGAEVELPITNSKLEPSLISQKILNIADDQYLQHELNQYNLEYNLLPVGMKGNPFREIQQQTQQAIDKLNKYCAQLDSQVVPIGILPTLKNEHVTESVMTDVKRYKALSERIKFLRNGDIHLDINGRESLQMDSEAITLEGANTSFQLQIRVPPKDFPDVYNAFQIVTPLVVATAANSPILLNKLLWDETRVALFKQSVDCRRDELNTRWRQPHRVSYGYGWVRRSALECFAENVALFPALLPFCKPQNYKAKPGDGPDLFELRLHQGVVWHWNRAIYDPVDGGHLRIELRSLPSGPTVIDMMANAAFLIGLAYAIRKDIDKFLVSYPFMFAEYNFYRAAKHGLDAQLVWPGNKDYSQSKPIIDILEYYIQQAREALVELGVAHNEVNQLMDIIENRVKTKQNGAFWQKSMVDVIEPKEGREEAIKIMFEKYIKASQTGNPVHEWSLEV